MKREKEENAHLCYTVRELLDDGSRTRISLNTIKGHLKNLYRKLDATNRVTALETARRLNLI